MPSSYPISRLPGIAPETVAALKSIGIRTTGRYLEAAKGPKGRKQIAEKTGLGLTLLLEMATAADRMRVPGLSREYALLMKHAGVRTVREMKYRTPASLARKLKAANDKRKLVGVVPKEQTVGRWIEAAKKLPDKITYR